MDGHHYDGAGAGAMKHFERRQHPRVGVAWLATARTARGLFECMMIDLSAGGAKLTFADRPSAAPGDMLTLEIGAKGAFRAQFVWLRADYAGVRFVEPPERIGDAFKEVLPG